MLSDSDNKKYNIQLYSVIAWHIVLYEKLIFIQLTKKFSHLAWSYRIKFFTTAGT